MRRLALSCTLVLAALFGGLFSAAQADASTKPLKLWGCPGYSANFCESVTYNWYGYQYYYHLYQYLNANWTFHHRDYDCWHNADWTNPDLLLRCNSTTFWTFGSYHHFLSTQINVKRGVVSAHDFPPGTCNNYPNPTSAYYPNQGHKSFQVVGHSPPYECEGTERVPGSVEETGSW